MYYVLFFIDNDMQTMEKPRSLSLSNYETKTNLPQGTGEKAKESIQRPELDITRLINASEPKSHKKNVSSLMSTSSTSSSNSSSLSSPINQSTSSLNSITISVINEKANEKETTPKGKKLFSISKDTIRNATKQTNDSSSKNKNGSNSTTESSVNPNPTSPLLRAVYSKWYCLNGLDTLYYGSSSSSLVHQKDASR